MGRSARLAPSRMMCSRLCVPGLRARMDQWAYRYPPSSAVWKNSMAVIQTAADPPNHGRIIFAIIGWTWKSRKALRKMVII